LHDGPMWDEWPRNKRIRVRYSFRLETLGGDHGTPILSYYSWARRVVLRSPPLCARQLRSWLVGYAFPILLFYLNARCGERLALCPCRNRFRRREKRDAVYAVLGDEPFHPITR
jgi:hypothetical protein